MNNIQQAVLEGIKDEFVSEPQYRFETPNNPIQMLVNGKFRCEIRVDVMSNRVEVWMPTGKGYFSSDWSGPRPSCYPFQKIPLESPDCFETLFAVLRKVGNEGLEPPTSSV